MNSFTLKFTGGGVIKLIDEILSKDPNAAGLAINWHMFGSNYLEKADYSRGVLERFTRRAPDNFSPDGRGNAHVKTIANPRTIDSIPNPHFARYFEGFYSINENGGMVDGPFNDPITGDQIVINHYNIKSREEYINKAQRGRADFILNTYKAENFSHDKNQVLDDGILKYRDARAKIYQQPDKSHADERLFKALLENLLPTFLPNTSTEFYSNKMEMFLTCRAVASYLKTKSVDDESAKFFEEASLKAILKSLDKMSLSDTQLLIRELPKLLSLSYPVAKELLVEIIQRVPYIKKNFSQSGLNEWFIKLYNLQNFLVEILNIKKVTARIDVKLVSTEGDFQILSVSDENATIRKPGWLQKDGVGYQIQSYAGNLEVIAKSTVDGKITMTLLGIDVRDSENKPIPHWVDYTELIVNGNVILDKLTPAWHNKPYNHAVDAKAGEEIKIQVEWLPHRSNN